MAKGAGQHNRVARALLLFSATLISSVDAVIFYDMLIPSFTMPPTASSILVGTYLVGVVGIVGYFVLSRKREKEGNLLAFAIAMALLVFVLPAFAQSGVAKKTATASNCHQLEAV